MKRRLHTLLFAFALLFVGPRAQAEETASPPSKPGVQTDPSTEADPSTVADPSAEAKLDAGTETAKAYGHGRQFGLKLGYVLGYNITLRYPSSPFCTAPDKSKVATDQKKICGFGAPGALDIAASFAPFDSVEPFLWARFGLSAENESNTNALRVFGVGARVYTSSDSQLKLFFEPAVGFETEVGMGSPAYQFEPALNGGKAFKAEYKKDLLFHVAFGPHFDVARALGFYLHGGVDVAVLRGIRTTLELQIGAQARFP